MKSRTQRTAAALAAAACFVLACPDYDVWWLGFVAWVLWLVAIDGVRPRTAFLYGWITGTATVFTGFFWMTDLLTRFAGFPMALAVPITLLFALYQGLLWSLSAALVAWFRDRTGWSPMLLAPMAWVAVEALLPNIFPIYLALVWSSQPLWIQAAELGGVTTVSFIAVAMNAALYCTLRAAITERRLDRRAAGVFFALLVGVPAYGAIRIAQVERAMAEAPKLRFGVVQGNMSIRQILDRRWRPTILSNHQLMSKELEEQGAEVLLWGETAYPNPTVFKRASEHDVLEDNHWRVRRHFTVPLIFGTVTRDHTRKNPYAWNSALVMNADSTLGDRYDKVFLLVFGEYIPIVDPKWFLDLVPAAAHLNRGEGPGVLRLGDYRLGGLICYEDILPRFVRDTARQDVHALVNLTNDSWFGKTDEPSQHLGLAVFRTIEQRRPMVRAVNTGISTYVDPTGRALHKTRVTDPDIEGPQQPEGFVAEVPMIAPGTLTTLYAWTGELFNGIVIAGLGLIGIRFRRRRE